MSARRYKRTLEQEKRVCIVMQSYKKKHIKTYKVQQVLNLNSYFYLNLRCNTRSVNDIIH